MKRKLCNLIWISFVACMMLLGGCSENVQEDFLNENNIAEMYVDSVFLGFEGDLIYPEVIWGNVDTYLRAFERMKAHLKLKDGALVWNIKNGDELNISENIFEYVTGWWSRQNEKLNSGDYKLEIQENGYYIVPIKVEKEPLQSRVGQYLIRGQHRYNMNILKQLCENVRFGNSLSYYIENLWDATLFNPNLYYGSTSTLGRWSYNCDNACFYVSSVDCSYNQISGNDREVRVDEVWEKLLGLNGLPLVSIMNYRFFKL
ncbi:MAG: hypothetical protein ACLUPL_11210 [Butyricimonas virosa]